MRVRPLIDTETKAGYSNVLTKENGQTIAMPLSATSNEPKEGWEFDKIFNGTTADGNSQEAVFKDTIPLITSAIDGFNVVSGSFMVVSLMHLP